MELVKELPEIFEEFAEQVRTVPTSHRKSQWLWEQLP